MKKGNKTNARTRKPGAQPGNKNAERHGFYSKHFNVEEAKRLTDSDRSALEDEIDLLRVYVSRISELVSIRETISDQDLKALNTLSLMTQSIATMTRTNYLTKGHGGAVEQGILEALEELRLEMGL